eukprot:TRINITY_DN6200_c0_g1_i1.p1 TRINITY_DN6200_c0_g1~~TRINITY_DN6200_c0_g1_i1.p1  ORF type:complete len:1100 (+),score=307.99 TRINITY_DN6200_c0_g1_i1:83-3382(+)
MTDKRQDIAKIFVESWRERRNALNWANETKKIVYDESGRKDLDVESHLCEFLLKESNEGSSNLLQSYIQISLSVGLISFQTFYSKVMEIFFAKSDETLMESRWNSTKRTLQISSLLKLLASSFHLFIRQEKNRVQNFSKDKSKDSWFKNLCLAFEILLKTMQEDFLSFKKESEGIKISENVAKMKRNNLELTCSLLKKLTKKRELMNFLLHFRESEEFKRIENLSNEIFPFRFVETPSSLSQIWITIRDSLIGLKSALRGEINSRGHGNINFSSIQKLSENFVSKETLELHTDTQCRPWLFLSFVIEEEMMGINLRSMEETTQHIIELSSIKRNTQLESKRSEIGFFRSLFSELLTCAWRLLQTNSSSDSGNVKELNHKKAFIFVKIPSIFEQIIKTMKKNEELFEKREGISSEKKEEEKVEEKLKRCVEMAIIDVANLSNIGSASHMIEGIAKIFAGRNLISMDRLKVHLPRLHLEMISSASHLEAPQNSSSNSLLNPHQMVNEILQSEAKFYKKCNEWESDLRSRNTDNVLTILNTVVRSICASALLEWSIQPNLVNFLVKFTDPNQKIPQVVVGIVFASILNCSWPIQSPLNPNVSMSTSNVNATLLHFVSLNGFSSQLLSNIFSHLEVWGSLPFYSRQNSEKSENDSILFDCGLMLFLCVVDTFDIKSSSWTFRSVHQLISSSSPNSLAPIKKLLAFLENEENSSKIKDESSLSEQLLSILLNSEDEFETVESKQQKIKDLFGEMSNWEVVLGLFDLVERGIKKVIEGSITPSSLILALQTFINIPFLMPSLPPGSVSSYAADTTAPMEEGPQYEPLQYFSFIVMVQICKLIENPKMELAIQIEGNTTFLPLYLLTILSEGSKTKVVEALNRRIYEAFLQIQGSYKQLLLPSFENFYQMMPKPKLSTSRRFDISMATSFVGRSFYALLKDGPFGLESALLHFNKCYRSPGGSQKLCNLIIKSVYSIALDRSVSGIITPTSLRAAELGGCIIGCYGFGTVKDLINDVMTSTSMEQIQSNFICGQLLAYTCSYAIVYSVGSNKKEKISEEISIAITRFISFLLEILKCGEKIPSPSLSFPLTFFHLAQRVDCLHAFL